MIGGGVAGLAAALEVLRQGHEVHLLEAGDAFGGQVRTFDPTPDAGAPGEPAGDPLECFYHHLFRSDAAVVRLIEELGLAADLEWLPTHAGMFTGTRCYDFDGAADLLRFDPVGPVGRLRLGLGALWLRRTRDWHRYEGRTAASWLPSAVGTDAYRRVWLPLLRAKFGPHAERVSLAWFWGKMYLRFASRDEGLFARERLGYLRGSFGRLVDAMVARIRTAGGTAEHGARVERVAVATVGGGPRVTGVHIAGRAEPVAADAVILTTPAPAAARLVPELAAVEGGALVRRLESIGYQWATVLVLALDRPLSPYYWLTVTDPGCPFVLAVEQTNLVPAARYGGRHLVYLSNYADPGDPAVSATAEETFRRALPWLRRIHPGFDPAWVRARWLFRDRAGQPVVDARYHERIPPLSPGIGGLFLASAAQIYPQDRGQNYAIELGERAAQLAIARHRGSGPARRAY